jgi:hypothetical protein
VTLVYDGVPGLAVPGAFVPGLAYLPTSPPSRVTGVITITAAGPGAAQVSFASAGPLAAAVTIAGAGPLAATVTIT